MNNFLLGVRMKKWWEEAKCGEQQSLFSYG
jgi:hypothetical protein